MGFLLPWLLNNKKQLLSKGPYTAFERLLKGPWNRLLKASERLLDNEKQQIFQEPSKAFPLKKILEGASKGLCKAFKEFLEGILKALKGSLTTTGNRSPKGPIRA